MKHLGKDLANREKHYDSVVKKIVESGLKIDSIFTANELKTIEKELYMVEVREGSAQDLFPSDATCPAYAESFAYKVIEKFGKSKFINDAARDFEKIALTAREVVGNIKKHGQFYGYNDDEFEAASALQMPLDRTSAEACREASDELVNETAFYGNETYNLPGLLSNANVPVTTAPLNGGATSRLFQNKTADEILDDLHDIVFQITDSTFKRKKPDTIAMAPGPWNEVFTKRLGTDSTETVYQHFLNKHPYIKRLVKCFELEEPAGGWTSLMPSSTLSGDLMVAFEANKRNLFIQTPRPFTVKPAQRLHGETQIDTEAKTGGLVIRYPLSVHIYQGI